MITAPEKDRIFTEPYGLRVSVPRDGFTESALLVLRQMIRSKDALIRKSLGADSLDIQLTDSRLVFPWFTCMLSESYLEAVLCFISALCDRAKSGKPAPQLKDYESERYTFNHFLASAGQTGRSRQSEKRR